MVYYDVTASPQHDLFTNVCHSFPVGGTAPTLLKQGKIDIIPVNSCQNWYYERWEELFGFRLPYQAPIRESNHICLGNQDQGGVSACWVSGVGLGSWRDL